MSRHQHYGVTCSVPWCGMPDGRKSPLWTGIGRPWTAQEDEHLLASDDRGLAALAVELNRTRGAVAQRRHRLRERLIQRVP